MRRLFLNLVFVIPMLFSQHSYGITSIESNEKHNNEQSSPAKEIENERTLPDRPVTHPVDGNSKLENQPISSVNMLQLVMGLVIVLVTIVAVAWVMRRFGQFSALPNGAMKIIGGLSMGTRERIVLLQVGKTQLLIGVAPGRVQTLCMLDEESKIDIKTNTSVSFSNRLAAMMVRKNAL